MKNINNLYDLHKIHILCISAIMRTLIIDKSKFPVEIQFIAHFGERLI